jgi:fatty-acyl-CoA synthase
MRSQRVAAVLSLVFFIIGGGVALTASHGTAVGWWDYPTGLKVLAPGFALGLAGSVLGIVWIARALKLNNSAGWKFGAVGLAGSLLVAGIPLNQARLYLVSPPIHDISTDPEFPPPFKAVLPLRAGAANGPDYDGAKLVTYQGKRMTVAAAQKKAYLDIRPWSNLFPTKANEPPTEATPRSKAFWHAYFTMQKLGWNIVAFDETTGMVEASVASPWFGLTSDVAVRVKPAGRVGALIDIRAKSRTVENDMGFNAALVRRYRASL